MSLRESPSFVGRKKVLSDEVEPAPKGRRQPRSRTTRQHDLEVFNLLLNAAGYPKGVRDFTDALMICVPENIDEERWFEVSDARLASTITTGVRESEKDAVAKIK